MVIFDIFLTISDPNIHQNAPNCTILKNIFWGRGCPRTPNQSAWLRRSDMQIFKSEKKILDPPAKSWLRPCKFSF